MELRLIGLGSMGSAMASSLIETGHDVGVWNRSPEVGYLAAPVHGRPPVAASGPLNIVVGGPKELVDQAESVFAPLGRKYLSLVESAAADAGLRLPTVDALREVFDQTLATDDLQGADWAQLAEVSRRSRT